MNLSTERLVQLDGVRFLRRVRSGVVCSIDERELLVPAADLHAMPSATDLPSGAVVTLTVSRSFARAVGLERDGRGESRSSVEPSEPLWLFCSNRAIGGQATLRDRSATGFGVVVSRRAWKLVEALRESKRTGAVVEIARLPDDRYRGALVVWVAQGETLDFRSGLSLT